MDTGESVNTDSRSVLPSMVFHVVHDRPESPIIYKESLTLSLFIKQINTQIIENRVVHSTQPRPTTDRKNLTIENVTYVTSRISSTSQL